MLDAETEPRLEAARIRYAGDPPPGHPGTPLVTEASHEGGDDATAGTSPWLAAWTASTLPSMAVPADDPQFAGVRIPPLEFPAVSYPEGGRRTDRWVLACGGIAAAAAFAVAFVASGGLAAHPATTNAITPAVISQACPSVAP